MVNKQAGRNLVRGHSINSDACLVETRLATKQRLRLGLSVQMRQRLQLLRMSSNDLLKFIQNEIEGNPLLIQTKKSVLYNRMNGGQFFASDLAQQDHVETTPTLQAYLREQIMFSLSCAQEQRIALYLCQQLDEAGYFLSDLTQCAHQLGVTNTQVQFMLLRLQHFDPPGVFARSLSECLELQLKRQGLFDSNFAILLQNLPLIAQADKIKLAKLCDLSHDELSRRCDLIKKLNPKPGFSFGQHHGANDINIIIPDAFIDIATDNKIHISLNEAILPKLILHQEYSQLVGQTRQEHQFIKNCRNRADWLLEAMQARSTSLLKVITAIAEKQQDFLAEGMLKLKPLSLAQIATATSLHESTISRTVADKYVMIRQNAQSHRTYALRDFFSYALTSTTSTQSHATRAVQARLGQLIATQHHPLSDGALTKILNAEGISISRRTVTKYREKLAIASSHHRKKRASVIKDTIPLQKAQNDKT